MTLPVRLIGALLAAAAAATFAADVVRAQDAPNINILGALDRPKSQDEIERQQKIDDDYKKASKRVAPSAQATDPWGGVREPAKPATAAPAKKQAGAKPVQ